MDDRELRRLVEGAAKRDVPGGVDLWPSIERHLRQPKRHGLFAWLRAGFAPLQRATGPAVAVLALLVAVAGFAIWNAALRQTAATMVGSGTPLATEEGEVAPEGDRVHTVALNELYRIGPITMTITGVVRSQSETIIGFQRSAPRDINVRAAQFPGLMVDGERLDGFPVKGELLSETVIMRYPALPQDMQVVTATVGPFTVSTGKPATVTLDLAKIRNGGQEIEVQGHSVRVSGIGPTNEGGFRLAVYPVGDDEDFQLIGPGIQDVTIRDEHNQLYSFSGISVQYTEGRVAVYELRVEEPLRAETSQLTMYIAETGRTVAPNQLQIRLPQMDVISTPNGMETSTPMATATREPQPIVETDREIIVARMEALIQKHREQLFGEPGWIHIRTRNYYPHEASVIHAGSGEYGFRREGFALLDKWYRVDEKGVYDTALSLMYTETGEIQQRSIFVDRRWHNLTLREMGVDWNSEGKEPIQEEPQLLVPGQFSPSIVANSPYKYEAVETSDEYQVTFEGMLDESDWEEGDPRFSVPIYGLRKQFVFDVETGQLMQSELYLLGPDDEWLQGESEYVLVIERMPELPAGVAQLYEEAVADVYDVPESAPEPVTMASRQGVTLTVQNVEYGGENTIITVHNQVGAGWGMDPEIFPPQQVHQDFFVLTDDKGNMIEPQSGTTGHVEADPATGGVQSENRLTFEAISTDAKTLTLTINRISLYRLRVEPPLVLDLVGREVGEQWTPDQSIEVQGVQVPIATVELFGDYLRIGMPVVTQDGLEVSCLSLSYLHHMGDCYRSGDRIITSLAMENLPEEVTFEVYASVSFSEPWTLSWDVE